MSKLCMYKILIDILNLSSNKMVSFILPPSVIESIHFTTLDNSKHYLSLNFAKQVDERLYITLMCISCIIRDADLFIGMKIRIKRITPGLCGSVD